MSLKSILLRRWIKHIEDPTGFPDNPTQEICWIWTGNVARTNQRSEPGRPRARLAGQLVNPRRVLFELHTGETPPRLRTTCKHPLCINPLHVKEGIKSEQIPKFDPLQIDWDELFTTLGLSRSLSAEEIARQTGAPIEAAQQWLLR